MTTIKTNYSATEFNTEKHNFGISIIKRMIANAKLQNVEISKNEAVKILRIENMCEVRSLNERFRFLENAGLHVSQKPMKTGHGVGSCFTRMNDGRLRVRVSANWGVKFGNYANVVHI